MIGEPAIQSAQLNKNLYMSLLAATMIFALVFPMTGYTKTLQNVNSSVRNSVTDRRGDSSEYKLRTNSDIVDDDDDGDGLPDFQEIHKYLTDPTKKDTDGDGVPDSDWNERREYTYSVRTILRFMPPFDKAALNDDYQDARVLSKSDDYIELEVIHYPLATPDESIRENPNWQQDYAGMTEYLKPGATTNWDKKMKQDLLAELRANEILIDKLTDKQVVERVSPWLMKRSRSLDKVFTTYYVHFPNGQTSVYPGLEGAFEREFGRDNENYDWTIDQHFDHELLGKGMFYNKTHGSCTSFAIYLTTVLRALGIPTRMIIVVPATDPSDKEQLLLVNMHIIHNKVRETMLAGLRMMTHGFIAHTFNEVYIGNHWRRLNYNKLGQPILDQHLFGLHTHLYTFNDLNEADLSRTWGWRYGKAGRNSVFKHDNPYSAVAISDLFGCHSNLPNPPFAAEESSSHLPNIFIMSTSGIFVFKEIIERVQDVTYNKTGRFHEKKSYDEIFDGTHNKKSGDIIVLLFSLDTDDRIPAKYEDLLPAAWPAIESALKQEKVLELKSNACEMNIIVLAAPTTEKLRQLVMESNLLSGLKGSTN
ncbi:MAG: transglutaminase domain-containing protein [Sedimentisphaerales bacterium]|nr:transglutaminase domain-containing protein [Sedimentisphaerales bacterium]